MFFNISQYSLPSCVIFKLNFISLTIYLVCDKRLSFSIYLNKMCFAFQEDVKLLSHLLQALDYGAPPHGGIALGKEFAFLYIKFYSTTLSQI